MKLSHIITLRMTVLTTLVLLFWSGLFYFAIVNEINDEVDDSLDDYAEMIIIRFMRNEPPPSASNGSNNQFFLKEVTQEYAASVEHVRYEDRKIYIEEKEEFEPARVLTYVFQNDDDRYFELTVSTPHIDKRDLRDSIFFLVAFLFIVLLLSILVMIYLTFHQSMRPLRKLLAWLDRYRVGEENCPLDNSTSVLEFRKLNDVVSESIQRTEDAYKQQKLFVANASHEIQTPLAISINRLEMLLEDSDLTEGQAEEVIKTKHTLERLSRMNRSLLLLTKIENGQFGSESNVTLDDTVRNLLPDYELVYASKHIRLHTEWKEHFTVRMDVSLAQTLVSNLLKNAFVHNHEGGEILISSTSGSLVFDNTGTGESLDKRIFERFFHGPDSDGSMGLGLSVAKAICQRYGLSLDYLFIDGRHRFIVK